MMVLRARSLAMGYSGARPEVAEAIVALLNAGVTPVVHEHGSLGASGDLAPLAAVALVLVGDGDAELADGARVDGATAMAAAGLEPLALRAKEGLALINGTDGMLGMLVLALADLGNLLQVADIAAAMSVEALLGTDRAFAEDLLAMRPQVGQAASAANLRRLLAGSPIVASHRHGDSRVQDAYSLRCTPQVHGAARDTVAHATAVADRELVSFIDNPVVLPDGRVESCGNFHGAPVAAVADFLAISIADVGALSERRTDRLLDPVRSAGLPPFLAPDAGVNSGLMIGQYTQAAMVAENRRLAVPASTDTLPTSAMQEDHVSLGWSACRKLRAAVANLARILAVELTAATWGLELRRPLRPAAGTGAVAGAIVSRIGAPDPTGSSRRGWKRSRRWCPTGRSSPPPRRRSARSNDEEAQMTERNWSDGARPVERAAGNGVDVPRMAAGSGDADADEQPRPGGRRAPRRPRRLRRHRAGRPLVAGVRRHRRHAAHARRRRDAARPVGQTGRGVPHPRVVAARADRQLEPRPGLGRLGRVPPPRSRRADDVRPDDGRARGSTSARRASSRARTSASPRSPDAASTARWPARSRSPRDSAGWAAPSRWP